jgi:hypothetical protein
MDSAAAESNQDYRKTFKHRAAVAAVIILSILIVLALIALVVGAIFKFGNAPGKKPASAPAATTSQPFSLPAGARIISNETQGNRLILRVRNGAAEDIYIVDTSDGHLISRIQGAAPE